MNPSRVIVHRVPSAVATSSDASRPSAAEHTYEWIIHATAPLDIAKAMVHAGGFDVTPFGIDNTHFHYGCDTLTATFAANPTAVGQARDALLAAAKSFSGRKTAAVTEMRISGEWIAIYPHPPTADTPDWWGSLQALAALPALDPSVEYWRTELYDRVEVALGDTLEADLDGDHAYSAIEWMETHRDQVRELIVGALAEHTPRIVDSLDYSLEAAEGAIRAAVAEKIGNSAEGYIRA